MVGSRSVFLALLLLALLPASAAANTTTRLIVKRDAGLSAAERADVRADAGVRFVESLPLPRTEVVAAKPGDVADALRDLNADPDVVYAERVLTRSAADHAETHLWGLERVQAIDAWGYNFGAGETVGVIDSGIDVTHPDLVDRIAPGGYDFVDDDTTPYDEEGHGTHVAGTIAATRDTFGVAGVAPEAELVSLRVLDENGDTDTALIAAAIDYAGDHGIRIVNVSIGGVGASLTEYLAIRDNPDVLVVAAAGNGDDPADTFPYEGDDNDDPDFANYPCAYSLPNILCVGASDDLDRRADFSNYGEETVDVFAPGVDIYSTWWPGHGYGELDGTSMATPHVTGTAALVLAESPGLTPGTLAKAIIEEAQPSVHLADISVSGGVVNAFTTIESSDVDGDTVLDRDDNCPVHPNTDQADTDGDGTANACDDTPRGADDDRDGVGAMDDVCPTQTGNTGNGCYVPVTPPTTGGGTTPPPADRDGDGVYDISDACATVPAATSNGCPKPQVTGVSAKVKKRRGKRSATVRVSTDGLATVRITVERKKGRRWVRVTRKTRVTSRNRVTLTVKGLRRGAHRVRISISSAAGRGTSVTKSFRVR